MFGRKRRPKVEAEAASGSQCLFYVPRITGDQGLWATDSRGGYIFAEVLKVLGDFMDKVMPQPVLQNADQSVNIYIRNYGMVLALLDHEGNLIVYSANYRNRLPTAFADRLRRDLGVMPDSTILWASDVYVTPRQSPAREVIWGEKLSSPPKETRRRKKEKWQHPDALTPEEMDYLMGRTKEPPKP